MDTPPVAKMLGRKAPDLTRKKVQFGQFLAVPPPHPPVDLDGKAFPFGMARNDEAGCCVAAAISHALACTRCIFAGAAYREWTDAELLECYASQNPGFKSWADSGGSHDNGMVVAQALDWAIEHKKGILAYAQIDVHSFDEMLAATWLGGAVITGENLQVAQQDTQLWDYVPGSPDWGGHATTDTWYKDNGRIGLVSWGSSDYEVTQAFQQHRVDESYFLLTPEMLTSAWVRAHLDAQAFHDAVFNLTHGKIDFPIPPAPPPAPVPPAVFTYTPSPEVYAHIVKTAAHEKLTPAAYVELHFRHLYKIK